MQSTLKDPLVQAFARLLRDHAEAPLIASPSRRATVGQVDTLARSAQARLEELRLDPGAVVGLSAPNGPGFLAALLACLRSGAIPALLDHPAPAAGRREIVERFDGSGLIRCDTGWPSDRRDFTVESTGTRKAAPLDDSGTVIKLTSGSTGQPRGILTPTSALLADDDALRASMEIRETDRLLASVPFSHSYGLSSLVLPALTRGILLVLADGAGPFQPIEAAAAVEATVFPTVPAYLSGLLRVGSSPDLPPSIRLVISAGAPLRPETARAFRARYGQPVHVFYGASESGGITYDRTGHAAEEGTVGTPIEGVRIRLESDDATGDSSEGRIVVTSPSVARAYFPEDDPRLANGCYASQDLGSWRNGELSLIGRLGNLINVKGKKVDPCEVERVIGEIPLVEEVKVLGQPRTTGDDELVRAVVACPSGELTSEFVASWCRDRLLDYKVPRSIVLVERLPVDERGKVDRQALVGEKESRD